MKRNTGGQSDKKADKRQTGRGCEKRMRETEKYSCCEVANVQKARQMYKYTILFFL